MTSERMRSAFSAKTVIILLAVALVFSMVPFGVPFQPKVAEGQTANLTFTFDMVAAGNATIQPTGFQAAPTGGYGTITPSTFFYDGANRIVTDLYTWPAQNQNVMLMGIPSYRAVSISIHPAAGTAVVYPIHNSPATGSPFLPSFTPTTPFVSGVTYEIILTMLPTNASSKVATFDMTVGSNSQGIGYRYPGDSRGPFGTLDPGSLLVSGRVDCSAANKV